MYHFLWQLGMRCREDVRRFVVIPCNYMIPKPFYIYIYCDAMVQYVYWWTYSKGHRIRFHKTKKRSIFKKIASLQAGVEPTKPRPQALHPPLLTYGLEVDLDYWGRSFCRQKMKMELDIIIIFDFERFWALGPRATQHSILYIYTHNIQYILVYIYILKTHAAMHL